MDEATGEPLYLTFLPYLTMSGPVAFGGWWLGRVDDFEGNWASARFRDLSLGLLAAFQDADGKPVARPALLARAKDGATGDLPEHSTFQALQRAIHFGSLVRNPYWAPGNSNEGWSTSTSDNSDIVAWPIDITDGRVTKTRGAIVRIKDGGYTIGDELKIRAPLELHLPSPHSMDDEILSGTYEVLMNEALGDRSLAHRIGVSIDWLAHAWRNSRSITFENRIVMLKTAFDALSGTGETYRAAAWLEATFKGLEQDNVDDEDFEELLWSPSEKPRLVRTWSKGKKSEKCTDLVHWFHAFADVRNEIVHEGRASNLSYEMEESAYQGPLSDIGERLLRETIRVCLRSFGFDDLWQPHKHRMLKRAFEEAKSGEQTAD